MYVYVCEGGVRAVEVFLECRSLEVECNNIMQTQLKLNLRLQLIKIKM